MFLDLLPVQQLRFRRTKSQEPDKCVASHLFPFLFQWMLSQAMWCPLKIILGANVGEHGGKKWTMCGMILT